MSNTAHINFTKTAIAALPAAGAGQRATYYDVKTRGLMILVTARGAKTFYVRRKINGRAERVHIGRFPEWTVERARARADEINAAFGRGDNPAEARREGRSEMTLNDLFAEYVKRNGPHLRRPDKPKTNYRLYLGHWGSRKLSAIKHHEVDSWHKQLARDKSNVTANIALKLLHVMFNKAINEWRIWSGDNPAHGIGNYTPKPEPKLSPKGEVEVRKVAKNLLETLKREKLVLDWREKQQARAAVRKTIARAFEASLPSKYSEGMRQAKTDRAYAHIYDCYFGAGRSVYDRAAAAA